ncbi:hypothetical protein G6F54_014406 [Rhizopus delemar]|nr:hypothetical protein G6F54_014406 [Rhizopus delemar]
MIIGASHSDTASRNHSGASQKRTSPACRRTRGQCRAAARAAGTIISRASMPTPLVITPMPAKNQPSHHQRQAGPSSRRRSRP